MDRPDVWQYPPVDASRRSIAVWESVGRGMAAGIITGVVTGGTVLAGIIVTETAASWLQALLLYTMAAGLLGAPSEASVECWPGRCRCMASWPRACVRPARAWPCSGRSA